MVENWNENLKSELDYWRWIIHTNDNENRENLKFRLNSGTEIQDFIKPFITVKSRILDCGAGIATSLGKNYAGHPLDIMAIDVLANEYKDLLDSKNINPPIPTQYGSYESLKTIQQRFEFIYTRNSLDHCYDPVEALTNLIDVCRLSGFVMIQVYENEADRCNWEGLHQWNFNVEDNKLMLRNKTESIIINKTTQYPIIKLDKKFNGEVTEITAIIHKEFQW